jgi:hypothetical protein
MQSRGPAWWLLYGIGAVVAFMLAGRLVAMIFASFFSLLIVEDHLDRAGVTTGDRQVQTGFFRTESNTTPVAEPLNSIPGAARPLTAADLNRPSPPYLETPATLRREAR